MTSASETVGIVELDAPLKNSPVNGGPQVNMTLRQWLEADTREAPHKRARAKALALIEQQAATIAERDARIEQLEDLIAEYGDRIRMARAEPAEKQWLIDEVMSNVAHRTALAKVAP